MTEESLFNLALNTPAADRAALLDRECAGDPALRAHVIALLAAYAGGVPAGTRTFDPDATATLPPPGVGQAGQVVAGRYTLVEPVGEGGMGTVWRARQTDPVKRFVAVKLVKAGMDSKAVLARFDAERQALALMDHPNIAKILDGGLHDGRPFFVMELVKGTPITAFCDARKLTPRERLELFVPVCQAIQHAHQKGVIHRDIKPANVLVALYDDRPVPKVIDFGVAKATGGTLTELTIDTGFGGVVGTPQYMSPEQATFNNLDIDTRSDVYSLGVLLYELLAGSPPFAREELRKAGVLEILRVVREEEPPRPSVKLSTAKARPSISASRGTEPGRLTGLLRSELDWIVMKAIDKDRGRRYETANGFAADVQRYLSRQPVMARPPSTTYKLRKAWQRNQLPFAAAGVVAASLLLGIAASTWQAVRANREAARADGEAALSSAALDELRATAPAFAEQARALAAREQFDAAVEKLDYAAKLRPDEADYPLKKGDLLQCQLRLAEAAAAYRAALDRRPGDGRGEANLALCEELLAGPRDPNGQLSREQLSKLLAAMERQQRPAAELMPVSRRLGVEKSHALAYWADRLKGLPVAADRPLAQRLTVRADGALALDLGGTGVTDLAPLEGAPIAELSLWNARGLTDISALRGMKLTKLNLSRTGVADLSPLRGMRTLEKLDIKNTPVSDLAPLAGVPLRWLELSECPVRDIAPLRGAQLEHLDMPSTRVTDLSPLRGAPLKHLDMGAAPVTDFSPLKGLPLEVLNLPGCQVNDLEFLAGSPLRELMLWNCPTARNFAALRGITTLELLILPITYRQLPEPELDAIEALRALPKLRQVGEEAHIDHTTTRSAESFWKIWDTEKAYTRLRRSGFRYRLTRLPGGTYSVNVEDQPFSDLSILEGTPTSNLWLNGCKVSDLSPLAKLPLVTLRLSGNPVSDLGPLKGLPIAELWADRTGVRDLTFLKGMPLKKLFLHECRNLKDITPLAGLPDLQYLTVPADNPALEPLRGLIGLKFMAFGINPQPPWHPWTTAAQFWAEYEQNGWLRRLRTAGVEVRDIWRNGDGTWHLNVTGSTLADLAVLAGAPLASLDISRTKVSDLTPLRGMPLTALWAYATAVKNLSPLEGMKLTHLNVTGCPVRDIGPLRGMPLDILRLTNCAELVDVSPLTSLKETLRELTLPPNAAGYGFLRSFPKLEQVDFEEDSAHEYRPKKTASEFWAWHDDPSRVANKP